MEVHNPSADGAAAQHPCATKTTVLVVVVLRGALAPPSFTRLRIASSEATQVHECHHPSIHHLHPGAEPTDQDVLQLMMKCPTNGMGRVREEDWGLVLEMWLPRPMATLTDVPQKKEALSGCCAVS
ncbi:hypothetical protein FOA52_003333 [Chlamydomonas sp. UWO 241]|nr:hypothetical protein FOA52_003333 [Chlamydomonas sp. UWO 241]